MLPRCRFVVFWAATAVAYALVFPGAEFSGSPVAGVRGLLELSAQWFVVAACSAGVIGSMALAKRCFAATFPLLTMLSAVALWYRMAYGMSLTPTVVELAVVNDLATWSTVVSPAMILFAVAGLVAGGAVACYRYRRVDAPRHAWILALVFTAVTLAPVTVVKRFKAPVTARMPYSFWFSVSDYLANRTVASETRTTFDRTPVDASSDSLTVVVVIGESLRPDHMQINGYARATTPHLSADTAVVSLGDMWTDPCYTHVSVPYIMTRADSLRPHLASTEQSFITLFKRAGFATTWISNQDAAAGYAYFLHEADRNIRCNGARSLYGYGQWLDTDMLPALDSVLAADGARKLVVMHTIGSHWWYRSHYPDSLARFKPEIDSRIVSELSREQMVNSYDNTIVATDDFLGRLFGRLRADNAVVVFVSDHGEALGEDGNYLHGADYEQLHHTACFVWYSKTYSDRWPQKVAALRRNASRRWRTDAIFHSVADGAALRSPVINRSMSFFNDKQ